MKAFWISAWTVFLVLASSLAGILLSHVALGVGPDSTPWPRFGVAVVFFWLLHRPGAMTVPMIFAIGLVQDLVLGEVPGAGVLALLATALLLDRMFPTLRTLPLGWRWLGFGAFAGMVCAIDWTLTSAARLAMQPLDLVVSQGAVTIVAYPLVSIALRQVLRVGRTPRRAL